MNNIDILEKELKELCKSGKRIKIEDMKRIFVACDLIETLIAENKELKEEKEDLIKLADNKKWISPCYVAENYIQKSKVEEIIKKLDRDISNIWVSTNYDESLVSEKQQQIDILQSLLGKE